jgi:NADPH-dependent 2,4-dienoyl-CoA reductase/sulfur reductase-like enzyme
MADPISRPVRLNPAPPNSHPSLNPQYMAQVIVVGGGLAGLSAAHTLLERGANVLLLDKQGSVSFSLQFLPNFILS